MKELVSLDTKYIIYDMSNDDDVYRTFAEKVIHDYKDKEEYQKILPKMQTLLDEINNPRQPEAGKYKIPHMFLYEFIRNHYIVALRDGDDFFKTPFNLAPYIYKDCIYPEEYGKKLEELYLDDNNYLYYDGIFDPESAIKEGYYLGYGTDLDRNFWEAHTFEKGFLDIMDPNAYGRNHKIFAMVPKGAKNIVGSN